MKNKRKEKKSKLEKTMMKIAIIAFALIILLEFLFSSPPQKRLVFSECLKGNEIIDCSNASLDMFDKSKSIDFTPELKSWLDNNCVCLDYTCPRDYKQINNNIIKTQLCEDKCEDCQNKQLIQGDCSKYKCDEYLFEVK